MADRPRWLIFGIGNPSRGDDALGFLFIEALEAWLEQPGNAASLPMDVVLETDFQLVVEHALDLIQISGAIFVDATHEVLDAPYAVTRLSPQWDDSHTTHSQSPAGVLGVAERLGQTVPPCWQLAIPGQSFDLGDGLSAAARMCLTQSIDATLRALAGGDPPLFV